MTTPQFIILIAIVWSGLLSLLIIMARKKSAVPSCPHRTTSKAFWTQDGWSAECFDCDEILYLGDDYDTGCPKAGNVEA
jgi:hypothetical protein